VVRFGFLRQAVQNKTKFDRYSDPRMIPYDRIVGNLLEWSMPFLSVFWASLALSSQKDAQFVVNMGWIYVASRALYVFVAPNGGIGKTGAKTKILISTVPAYLALFTLFGICVKHVL
jgi:hypothetical protein